mgnify:CR=1 FL=1
MQLRVAEPLPAKAARCEMILSGQYDRAGLEPPRYHRGDIVEVARWVRDRAGRPRLCPDPVHYAARLGISVVDRVPMHHPDECCDGAEIRFRWSPQRRTRGGRVLHGLAHCALILAGCADHREADAWFMTAELAYPTELVPRATSPEAAAVLAPHAPLWLLAAQIRCVLREIAQIHNKSYRRP